MNKDAAYFHFANLGLALIGLFSIQKIAGSAVIALLVLGVVGGFLFSWYFRKSRPPHIDTFIGMLSLASVVIVLSGLTEREITFDSLLKIFSIALAWLTLFQSFGLSTQKSYSLVQFISAALLISSVSLALERESIYTLYLAVFLFMLIFTMRLSLVCEKHDSGSLVIGDADEVMSLWHQIKIGAIMFSIVLSLSALIYPIVPRFNNLSLEWIPDALLSLPEKIPILKIQKSDDEKINDAKMGKQDAPVYNSGKREIEVSGSEKLILRKKEEEAVKRFQASGYNKDIDSFKVESLTIRSDRRETPMGSHVELSAELKLTDGSVIPATKLVDWKISGTEKIFMDKNGKLTAGEGGNVQVSAVYMGVFSNDVNIKVIEPVKLKNKKKFLTYLSAILFWFAISCIFIFAVIVFIRSRKLSRLRRDDPREFVKEVYFSLCSAFKAYGINRFNYVSCWEFYDMTKELVAEKSESMQALTEEFMEARFSLHEISEAHSQKAVNLFCKVKMGILDKEGHWKFWKDILFRLRVLDMSLISK